MNSTDNKRDLIFEGYERLQRENKALLDACKLLFEFWDAPDRTEKQRQKRGHAYKTAREAIARAEGEL